MFWDFLKKTLRITTAQPKPFDAGELIRGIVETHVENQRMLAAAREGQQPYALLTPTTADQAAEAAGWFGGAPCLPADMPWPEIDGTPLRFACQIDLTRLPADIWSGIGPRKGWLAVFFHPETVAPRVLHVHGALVRRDGPGQVDAVWFWSKFSRQEPIQAELPRWPVLLTRHVGNPPIPAGFRKGRADGYPDPRETERPNFEDPAFHPFDWPTMRALIDCIADKATRWLELVEVLLAKKLRDEDRTKLETVKPMIRDLVGVLTAIRAEVARAEDPFDSAEAAKILARIAAMPGFDIVYEGTDADGYAVVRMARIGISGRTHLGYDWWYHDYAATLYQHAICAYTRNPAELPRPLRERMERIWRFEALHERGAMGLSPLGHVYTEHGPGTPNEVLLELPTSDLVGWMWGDVDSIVLFIDRKALEQGDFLKIEMAITN